jgi:hypothetical protein
LRTGASRSWRNAIRLAWARPCAWLPDAMMTPRLRSSERQAEQLMSAPRSAA